MHPTLDLGLTEIFFFAVLGGVIGLAVAHFALHSESGRAYKIAFFIGAIGWLGIGYFFSQGLYTGFVAVGAVVGLATAYFFLRAYSQRVYSFSLFLDAALVTFAAGWVGARVYHVAMNWDYYASRPDQIWSWETGGLGMRGAVIAGVLVLGIFARVRGVSFGRLADAAGLGLSVGQALGWVGAYVWGANYGAVSDSIIALELPNLYGIVEPRFPLQFAETGMFVLLFGFLLWFSARQPVKGKIFLIYLLVASAANFALGFYRGDESVYVSAMRVDQVFDAAFALCAMFGLVWQKVGIKALPQTSE